MVVVIYHASLVFPGAPAYENPWIAHTPLRLLFAGPVAVFVFFVLSGVVLSVSFIERDGSRYLPYAAKRVCRIYIPFAASIALSLVLKAWFDAGPSHDASRWLNVGTWGEAVNRTMLIKTFAMTNTDTRLNNPMWSLSFELRISLIFPLIVYATKKSWQLALASSIIFGAICVLIVGHLPPGSFVASMVQTGSYIVLFVAGTLITMHSRQLRSVLAEMNAPTRLVLWVVALAGLAKGPANTMYVPSLAEFALTIMNTAAASLLIILSIVEGRGMVFLLGRVPVFIGRISFSLYLVHMPVIAASVHSLPASWPLLARVVFGVVASVPVAVAFYEIVEHPSGKLSRRIGDHISKLQSPHKSRS